MLNRNRLEFHFADHSFTIWMQKALVELWRSTSDCRFADDARKDMIAFVQTLPLHNRRKESEEDFIMRHVLAEIEKRARNKWKMALNAFPPAYLSDYHIRNEVWELLKRTPGLGGFVNLDDGVYCAYHDDQQSDVFIYHFRDRPIPPEDMHEHSNLMTVVYKDVVVFIEYSCVFFNGANSPQKLEAIVETAIRNRMGE